MAIAQHVLTYRRKREGKTNYKKRLALLKSGKPRLVIRRSNKHLLFQLVTYDANGDVIKLGLSSNILAKHGWKHSTKSIPAAYFAGILFARAAKEKKIGEAIIDIGLQKHTPGNRLCAAMKGILDGGLSIPISETIFPSPDRLAGKHLPAAAAKDVDSLAKKIGVTLSVAPETKKKEAAKAAA